MARKQHLTETERQKVVEMFKKNQKKINIAKVTINRCIITKIVLFITLNIITKIVLFITLKRFQEYKTVKTA